jgi:predicted ATPase
MWLKQFEVTGFLGSDRPLTLPFNRDLNILTGKNGAGKTSALKLIWYIMSGNIIEALREVDFQKATLQTSEYTCTVHRLSSLTCRIELRVGDEEYEFQDIADDEGDVFRNAEDEAAEVLIPLGTSVFFPTFRRIEGGFTMNAHVRTNNSILRRSAKPSPIEEALKGLSSKLTNGSHQFVAAISTVDIVDLLQRTYSNLSEQQNELQRSMSLEIVELIRNFQVTGDGGSDGTTAEDLLGNIRGRIESAEESRGEIMAPIVEVQRVVRRMFHHKGIKLGRLNFGDAAEAISSDLLSAGEKQMLSFIAYNGLFSDSTILIDEPELSLHVDWQRRLFSTLQRQQSENQFIIATHSPFIYSKYPDKEVQISLDRGDAGE